MAIRIGVIGYGYWGPNLVRNFSAQPNCEVAAVCDSRNDRLEVLKGNYPLIETFSDIELVLDNKDIDAIVIATPVHTHYNIAKRALAKGKHVLIEKPMTSNVEEAQDLIQVANSLGKVLMVDHTFLYTGAIKKMKDMVDDGHLGQLQYFDSTRINLGLFQPDINVLWDLAPHDISILSYLVNKSPVSVNATGICHTKNSVENIAYLTLNYEDSFVAHFNCSWTSPVKIRTMLIGGDQKMLLFNDLEPTEKVKVYDTGYELKTDDDKQKILVDYRVGDVYVPKIDSKEALAGMAADFLNAIETGETPVSSAELGLNVVKILKASQDSIKNNGKEVRIT